MNESERTLGLDVGHVRIGVALCDPMGILASPHSVIACKSPAEDAKAIGKLVRETEAVRIVAGIPLNREGKVGPQAEKVLAFLELLRSEVDVEVLTQDERFSTAEAERMLIAADVSRKKRKKVVDKIAAQYILQTYLDRRSYNRHES